MYLIGHPLSNTLPSTRHACFCHLSILIHQVPSVYLWNAYFVSFSPFFSMFELRPSWLYNWKRYRNIFLITLHIFSTEFSFCGTMRCFFSKTLFKTFFKIVSVSPWLMKWSPKHFSTLITAFQDIIVPSLSSHILNFSARHSVIQQLALHSGMVVQFHMPFIYIVSSPWNVLYFPNAFHLINFTSSRSISIF